MHALRTFTGRRCGKRHTPINRSISSFPHTPTLDTWYPGATNSSATDTKSIIRRSKWEELTDSLAREHANPSRVWNTYLEWGSIMGFDDVPFEVQQQVLRKCVPRTDQLRVAAARRMQTHNQPRSPHIYESRLQTLIGHIRASGRKPTLEDYEFVLEQFAAVGHQTGARLVFQELTRLGVNPSYRTYGLCLQAIAHRLTLPCRYSLRPHMLYEANSICIELLDDMWTRHIPMTSVNFDLAFRIFKENESRITFEKLLRIGYGIDLANPDRPPLEAQGLGDLSASHTFRPLPFTTSALNTVIDMLGKTKQLSRMVTAFEVFTTPIPPPPRPKPLSEHGYVDDDDDDPTFYQFQSSEDDVPYEPPCAEANITTFNLLIKYAAKANHAVFARHYVVQAMELDRLQDRRLRAALASKPLSEIPSPRIAVNRGTFLPPFGFANRTRHLAFLRWGYRQTTLALRRKKECLAFYTKWRQKNDLKSTSRASKVNQSDDSQSQATSTPSSPPSPPQFKPLDLDLHLSLLTRDVEEMGELGNRMSAAVERLTQRLKERLGRRVWQGKNIFLATRNERVHVNRREWMGIVKFQAPDVSRDRTRPQHLPQHLPRTQIRTPQGNPPVSNYT